VGEALAIANALALDTAGIVKPAREHPSPGTTGGGEEPLAVATGIEGMEIRNISSGITKVSLCIVVT